MNPKRSCNMEASNKSLMSSVTGVGDEDTVPITISIICGQRAREIWYLPLTSYIDIIQASSRGNITRSKVNS